MLCAFLCTVGISNIKATEFKDSLQENGKRYESLELARSEILKLKNGVLIVRLKTKQSSIDALMKMNLHFKAEKVRRKQELVNLEIVKSFRKYFVFCPVYFIMSDQSKAMMEKRNDEVVFLNDSLLPDSFIKFPIKDYFIAEFGTIESDRSSYVKITDSTEAISPPNYYAVSGNRIAALLIYDKEFKPIFRPFPYYTRTFETFPIRRGRKKVVRKMNKKLVVFYNKSKKYSVDLNPTKN